MKTTKSIVILLGLILLTAGPAHSMERARKISETLKASCLVRISCDPRIFPADDRLLYALLHSSGVGGKAARDVLGISPDEVGDLIDLEHMEYLGSAMPQPRQSVNRTPPSEAGMDEDMYEEMMMEDMAGMGERPGPMSPRPKSKPKTSSAYSSRSPSSGLGYGYGSRRTRTSSAAVSRTTSPKTQSFASEETILVHLNVDLGESAALPAAEEFLDAVIDNLRSSLLKAFDDYKGRFNDHIQVADEETSRAEDDLRNKQERLRETSGSRVLDRNVILRDISELRDKIERIEMEQTSEAIILSMTAEQIAEIKHKAKEQLANDDITQELADMLKVQETNLQRVEQLHKAGTASTAEVTEAKSMLARSKIELAQRREQLNKSVGGNLIESLNAKLADSTIQRAQARTYLSTYQRQFREAEGLLERADDYDLLTLKAEIARQNLREVLVWRDEISRRARVLRAPSVSVLAAE